MWNQTVQFQFTLLLTNVTKTDAAISRILWPKYTNFKFLLAAPPMESQARLHCGALYCSPYVDLGKGTLPVLALSEPPSPEGHEYFYNF